MAITAINVPWAATAVPTVAELNQEFNNLYNWLNAFALTNPMTSDLDMDNNFILNARFKEIMRIRNAQEYATIQAAIDSLTSETDPQYQGGVVYCPPGVYDITSEIELADDIYIMGAGWKTILRKNTAFLEDDADSMIQANGISRFGIMNLQIDGQLQANTAGSGNGVAAIRIMGAATDGIIDQVYCKDWGLTSVDLDIKQNEFVYIGQDSGGGNSGKSERIWITRNRADRIARNGVGAVYCHDLYVLANWFKQTGNAWVDIEPNPGQTCKDIVVCQNIGTTTENGNSGYVFTGTTGTMGDLSRVSVSDNFGRECDGVTMALYQLTDFSVVRNQLFNGDNVAIDLRDAIDGVLSDNVVDTNTDDGASGIAVGAFQDADRTGAPGTTMTTERVVVTRNQILRMQGHGIQVSPGLTGTTRDCDICDNVCTDNGQGTGTRANIFLGASDGNRFEGNRMEKTAAGGGAALLHNFLVGGGTTPDATQVLSNRSKANGTGIGHFTFLNFILDLEEAHNVEVD
jgi:hypothetical protein